MCSTHCRHIALFFPLPLLPSAIHNIWVIFIFIVIHLNQLLFILISFPIAEQSLVIPFQGIMVRCRWDISLVSNAPIGTGFGPQNITVIMSQESHHWHVFLIRFAETHFPYSLETTT